MTEKQRALYEACLNEDIDEIELLIKDRELDVNITDKKGFRLFNSVCRRIMNDPNANIKVAELLLSCEDLDVNFGDDNNLEPLIEACTALRVEKNSLYNENTTLLDRILQRKDVDINKMHYKKVREYEGGKRVKIIGYTALDSAIRLGTNETCNKLLALKKMDLKAISSLTQIVDDMGMIVSTEDVMTYMDTACSMGDARINVIQKLLDKGVKPTKQSLNLLYETANNGFDEEAYKNVLPIYNKIKEIVK